MLYIYYAGTVHVSRNSILIDCVHDLLNLLLVCMNFH